MPARGNSASTKQGMKSVTVIRLRPIVYAARRSVIKKVDGFREKVSASSGIAMKSSEIITRMILSGGFIAFSAFAGLEQNSEKLAAANNGFAFDLFKQVAKEQPDKNIFISPFSVSTALQMVGDGAVAKPRVKCSVF